MSEKPSQVAIPVSDPSATVIAAPARTSYQFRALTRKTLSFQKRQSCTNICCVFLCPVMMVAIAGALAIVLQGLLTSTAAPIVGALKYCSKSPVLSPQNLPLYVNSTNKYLRLDANKGLVFEAGYFQLDDDSVTPDSSRFPCLQIFEPQYLFSSPYAQDPGVARTKSSAFLADPLGGWFDPQFSPTPVPKIPIPGSNATLTPPAPTEPYAQVPVYSALSEVQMFPWYYVFVQPGVNAGTKERGAASVDTNTPPPGSGFLGNTPTSYYKLFAGGPVSFYSADYFEIVDVPNQNLYVRDRLEAILSQMEDAFTSKTLENGTKVDPVPGSAAQLKYLTGAELPSRYPFLGAIYLRSLDTTANKISVTIQTSVLERLQLTAKAMNILLDLLGLKVSVGSVAPPVGFKIMHALSGLTNGLFASSAETAVKNTRIVHMLRALPYLEDFKTTFFAIDFGVQLGKSTFPFGLAFLLPIFVLNLVKDKEDRILIMMKMHGLSSFAYYATNYVLFFTLQILASIFFMIAGALFKLKFFTNTSPGVYIILFLVWANVMIGLAFLLSLCFSKSRPALISTFVLIILSVILTFFEDIIFNYEFPPNWWYLWPPFAFFRGLNEIGNASSALYRMPYQMKDLIAGDNVLTVILFLLFEGIFCLLLMAYLNLVLPSEYGIQKPWHFIFTEPFARRAKKDTSKYNSADPESGVKTEEQLPDDPESVAALQKEDSDAKTERAKVMAMKLTPNTFADYPLIIKNIRKVYNSGKVANHSMCLSVEKNIVFGLLGPNGAGKSTLIQMLTGLYPPSSGTAYVAGYDITKDMESVYLNIGVCPQHDILWEDLTIEEHLLFYARLRGVPAEKEASAVDQAIDAVELHEFKFRLSKQLSGGQKRRLSIAISLIGDVPVVFLDEPTTGLDVDVRRTIWNIIQSAKHGKTIILTSHSMEEIDFLAAKIGIMARGVLRCLGTPLHLKRKYGKGFKLTISYVKDADRKYLEDKAEVKEKGGLKPRAEAVTAIEGMLPEGKWTKVEQGGVSGSAIYEFDDGGKEDCISSILEKMDAMKDCLGVEDFGISQTTLEEVFLNIVKDEDAES